MTRAKCWDTAVAHLGSTSLVVTSVIPEAAVGMARWVSSMRS